MKQTKKEIADKIYDNILKKVVYPLLGDDTTYMDDLERVGRKLLGTKFKGVYPSDKIPKLNDLRQYCILNLDNSKQKGSHWVALAKKENSNNSLIYDSFGRCHTKILPNLQYSGNGRIQNTDRDIDQKIEETDCGARSMAWLLLFDKYGEHMAKWI